MSHYVVLTHRPPVTGGFVCTCSVWVRDARCVHTLRARAVAASEAVPLQPAPFQVSVEEVDTTDLFDTTDYRVETASVDDHGHLD